MMSTNPDLQQEAVANNPPPPEHSDEWKEKVDQAIKVFRAKAKDKAEDAYFA